MTLSAQVRELPISNGVIPAFRRVELHFQGKKQENVFALKNNKSLRDTLMHHRYAGLAVEAENYLTSMDIPLGMFLLNLKQIGDPFYKRFLNKHGDKTYSTFAIKDPEILAEKGLYAYYESDRLRYVGRCRDSMKKRINQGYGRIHPKNCFIDGQSTNCHLNAKITAAEEPVSLWFCSISEEEDIRATEAELISDYDPSWNVRKS